MAQWRKRISRYAIAIGRGEKRMKGRAKGEYLYPTDSSPPSVANGAGLGRTGTEGRHVYGWIMMLKAHVGPSEIFRQLPKQVATSVFE